MTAYEKRGIFGKDEVASSNLASSSKKSVVPIGTAVFLLSGSNLNWRPHPLLPKANLNREVVRLQCSKTALDPVASSNLASSSKNESPLNRAGFCFYCWCQIWTIQMQMSGGHLLAAGWTAAIQSSAHIPVCRCKQIWLALSGIFCQHRCSSKPSERLEFQVFIFVLCSESDRILFQSFYWKDAVCYSVHYTIFVDRRDGRPVPYDVT